jgi:hypothetical protein
MDQPEQSPMVTTKQMSLGILSVRLTIVKIHVSINPFTLLYYIINAFKAAAQPNVFSWVITQPQHCLWRLLEDNHVEFGATKGTLLSSDKKHDEKSSSAVIFN